ncbi:hypothetical protein HK102_011088 [Quaeritorhiza haematococci]|nr:hypothetical protein HK102_011088 [Quaeritorhiza haematococci]
MGAAFTAIVNSFVKDLITPIIGLAVSGSQLENSFVIIRGPDEISCSKNRTLCESIKTIEQAQAVGAVTWNWGSFLQTVINFMIISAIVFLVVKAYTAAFRRRPIKKMKECPFCFRDIPKKAIRCPECTSSLEGLVPKQKEKEKEKARRDSTAPEDGAAETRAKEKESRWKTLKLGKSEKEQV